MSVSSPQQADSAPTNHRDAQLTHVQCAAFNIQYRSAAGYVATEFEGVGESTAPLESFDLYLRDVMHGVGQPSDPIERIIVEQVVMIHHKIGRLNRQSMGAATPELGAIYDASAVSLLAELRRFVLLHKEYRTPVIPRNVTMVQQNVAHAQQVALVGAQLGAGNAGSHSQGAIESIADSKLTSNRSIEHVPSPNIVPQPSPRRRRTV